MGKLLGWIVVALLVWAAWKFWTLSKRRSQGGPGKGSAGGTDASSGRPTDSGVAQDDRPDGVERMVRCAHCDLHLPASDAQFASGKAYCSDEHLRLARTRDTDG